MEPKSILAPAKINLFLHVNSKRDDGYHELYTMMCAVSLYDLLIFSFSKRNNNSVICDDPRILDNESNLVNKAIHLFFSKMYKIGLRKNLKVNVSIRKRIPIGSGFGGGSSNAASTLLFLNSSFGFPFSKKLLMKMGREIGADVPFFIFGKPAIASGIGDHLEALRSKHGVPKFALLVYTGILVSTSWVYENLTLNENLGLTRDKKNLSKFHLDVSNFDCQHHLVNDLESVTETRYPIISEIKDLLLDLGAEGVLMSGSGSGVFGLYHCMKATMAAQVFLQNYWSKRWFTCSVSLLL